MVYKIRKVDKPSLIDGNLYHRIYDWVGYIEDPDVGRHWWVAFDENDNWVGFAGIQVKDADTVLLNPCEVKQEARGNGLQMEFIKVREDWAREQGHMFCLCLTNYDNIVSSNHLIKSGYKLRKPWFGAAGLGLYWTKDL